MAIRACAYLELGCHHRHLVPSHAETYRPARSCRTHPARGQSPSHRKVRTASTSSSSALPLKLAQRPRRSVLHFLAASALAAMAMAKQDLSLMERQRPSSRHALGRARWSQVLITGMWSCRRPQTTRLRNETTTRRATPVCPCTATHQSDFARVNRSQAAHAIRSTGAAQQPRSVERRPQPTAAHGVEPRRFVARPDAAASTARGQSKRPTRFGVAVQGVALPSRNTSRAARGVSSHCREPEQRLRLHPAQGLYANTFMLMLNSHISLWLFYSTRMCMCARVKVQ